MAKEFSRNQRMSSLLQRELAILLQQDAKDPRLGMVTIGEVEVSGDLSHAKVFVTILTNEQAEITANLGLLNKMKGFLRSALAKRIKARLIPDLTFIYDDSLVKGNRLAKLIDKVTKDLPSNHESDHQEKQPNKNGSD